MLIPPTASAAEASFLSTHARHASRLRVIRRDDRVEVEGEVDSFYRKQLLLRDAAAVWGGDSLRANITVRRPVPEVRSETPADVPRPRVLLATAEPLTLACCAGELRRCGFDVTATDTWTGCLKSLRAGGHEVLVLVGQLPGGGSDGVLELASAAGHLDRMLVICVGELVKLEGLSEEVTCRLIHVSDTTSTIEKAVARAVAEFGRTDKPFSAPIKS